MAFSRTASSWSTERDDAWKSQWWQCKVCHYWTPNQKGKCKKCGILKKYMSMPANASASWPPRDTTWHLNACDDGLAPTVGVPMHTPTEVDDARNSLGGIPSSSDIKELESHLRSLPQGEVFQSTRVHLEARVVELKRAITQNKSPSAQLMTCSTALERARKRYDSAQTPLNKAQNEFQAASTAVDHLTEECTRLQALHQPLWGNARTAWKACLRLYGRYSLRCKTLLLYQLM